MWDDSKQKYTLYEQTLNDNNNNNNNNNSIYKQQTGDRNTLHKLPDTTYETVKTLSTIVDMSKEIKSIQSENVKINKRIEEMQKKENRLLNRFGFLLMIANIGLVILVLIIIAIYINTLYPFVNKMLESDKGLAYVISGSATLLFGAIMAFWFKLEKMLNEVRIRDSKDV